VIRDCTINSNNGNTTAYGINDQGRGNAPNIITNCTIIGNPSYGIWIDKTGTNYPYVFDCQIRLNGRSAMCFRGSGRAVRCRLADNVAVSVNGGGVCFDTAACTNALVDRCIISGNTAVNGGGVYYSVYGGILRNCLIVSNRATSSGSAVGGGVYLSGTNAYIQNCTIVSNSAPNSSSGAGGLYYDVGGTNFIENTIIYHNTCGGTGSNYVNSGVGSYSNCCVAPVGTVSEGFLSGNIQSAPQLVNYQNGDYHLTLGSPCINSGVNRAWMYDAVDLDGVHGRIDGFSRLVDMGCYEYLSSGSMYLLGIGP
jgi:hypothetical protein